MRAIVIKLINKPKTLDTQQFYNNLMDGKVTRGIWGKNSRFDALLISNKYSVKKYYLKVLEKYISKDDRVIDYGCGSGGFLIATAPLCKEIVGAEISEEFIKEGQNLIKELGIQNASIVNISNDQNTFFPDNYFDVLIMVDVIHHLEQIELTLSKALRLLKPFGRVIIFEPNKFNPILAIMCLIDGNERGLLKLGTKIKYKNLLSEKIQVESIQYNGLLIGPVSKIFLFFADLINRNIVNKFLGWLNPKIIIVGRKLK